MAPLIKTDFCIRGKDANGVLDTRQVDENLIGRACYEENKELWLSVTVNFFLAGNAYLSHEQIINKLGFNISFNTYMHLRRAVSFARVRHRVVARVPAPPRLLGPVPVPAPDPTGITTYLSRKAKGSKHFRIVISAVLGKDQTKGKNSIMTLGNLLGINLPVGDTEAGTLLGLWNLNIWTVELKVFIFQFYNNSLPVGARVGNRYRLQADRLIDERCQLCNIGFNVAERESFQHLYFHCPSTAPLLDQYGALTFRAPDRIVVKKKIVTHTDNSDKFMLAYAIHNILFLHEIWKAKLRHKMPSFHTIRLNILLDLDGILKASKKTKLVCLPFIHDNYWYRSWWQTHGDGRGDGE